MIRNFRINRTWNSDGASKADSNLRDHAISFEAAVEVFADPDHVVIDTTRPQDGEVRLKAVGRIEGRLFTVVYTMRGTLTWVVSARRANRNEERNYG